MYHQPPAHLAHQAWRDGTELCWAVAKFASIASRNMTEKMVKGEVKLPAPSAQSQTLAVQSKVEAVTKLGLLVAGIFYPPDRKDVVDQLLDGRLVAFGFKMPRELSNPPTEIPRRVWTGKIDFKSNWVAGIGFSFVDVRVTTRDAWQATLGDAHAKDASVRPAGRTSRKTEIVAAYKYLREIGTIRLSDTIKKAAGDVREKIDRETGNPSGLSDDTLRTFIAPLHRPAA